MDNERRQRIKELEKKRDGIRKLMNRIAKKAGIGALSVSSFFLMNSQKAKSQVFDKKINNSGLLAEATVYNLSSFAEKINIEKEANYLKLEYQDIFSRLTREDINKLTSLSNYKYQAELDKRLGKRGAGNLKRTYFCVAAQEINYRQICDSLQRNLDIIPKGVAACIAIRDHFKKNYSKGTYEGCYLDGTFYRDKKSFDEAMNKSFDRNIKNRSLKGEERETALEEFREEFSKKNFTVDQISTGSWGIVPSTGNSSSGWHAITFDNPNLCEDLDLLSYNSTRIEKFFDEKQKSRRAIIFKVPEIIERKTIEMAKELAESDISEQLNYLYGKDVKTDAFDMSKINKNALKNAALSKFFNGFDVRKNSIEKNIIVPKKAQLVVPPVQIHPINGGRS